MYLKIVAIIFLVISNNIFSQENIELLGKFNPGALRYSDIWGYSTPDGKEYALMGGYDDTYIINVTDPSSIKLVSKIPGPSSVWRDIKIHSHYAYIVTEGSIGLQIVDLSQLPNKATLVETNSEFFKKAHNIFIDNGYAYVIGGDNGGGLKILDLTNPTKPKLTVDYTDVGYIHDVYVWNDTVVACGGRSAYHLIDVKDKSNPKLISSSNDIGAENAYAHAGWMTEDKRYFFATDEFNVFDLRVYDLKDRSTWETSVPSWQMSGNSTIHNIFIKGNYAHISYYVDGYVLLDISDPTNPVFVDSYDTTPDPSSSTFTGAWGCYPYLPSGNVLISDIAGGLYILKYNTNTTSIEDEVMPQNFNVKQNYPNPFNPSTNISIEIPTSEFVNISIFNLLGEKVKTIINNKISAGNHNFKFDAKGLNSGVYIANVRVGNKFKNIKMNLVK